MKEDTTVACLANLIAEIAEQPVLTQRFSHKEYAAAYLSLACQHAVDAGLDVKTFSQGCQTGYQAALELALGFQKKRGQA